MQKFAVSFNCPQTLPPPHTQTHFRHPSCRRSLTVVGYQRDHHQHSGAVPLLPGDRDRCCRGTSGQARHQSHVRTGDVLRPATVSCRLLETYSAALNVGLDQHQLRGGRHGGDVELVTGADGEWEVE